MANGWMDVEAMEALSVIRPFGALARWRAAHRSHLEISKTLRKLENNLLIITSSHHGLVLGVGNHTSVGLASHVEVVLDYRLLIA